jgi:Uma2 family endonuclease
MSTVERPAVAPLVAGQRLKQREFHELYEAMPPGIRAELIGGVVHMPSPVGDRHGDFCYLAITWLGTYSARTPGIKGGTESSIAIDDREELQPDVHLRISPEAGGRTHKQGNMIGGCPEFVLEVANSSKSIDLGLKLLAYERAGALTYIVFAIDPDEIFWHVREGNRLIRINPDPDGIYRSKSFPGLWLDPIALLAEDAPAVLATLERGLATEAHANFVADLEARKK